MDLLLSPSSSASLSLSSASISTSLSMSESISSSVSASSSSLSSSSTISAFGEFWCGTDIWGPIYESNVTTCVISVVIMALRIVYFPLLCGRFVQAIRRKNIGARKRSIKYRIQLGCCGVISCVSVIELIVFNALFWPMQPNSYLTYNCIVGGCMYMLAVAIMVLERRAFMPHNWILRSWWTLEFFEYSMELPFEVAVVSSWSLADCAWLITILCQLVLCSLLLLPQEALYSQPPSDDIFAAIHATTPPPQSESPAPLTIPRASSSKKPVSEKTPLLPGDTEMDSVSRIPTATSKGYSDLEASHHKDPDSVNPFAYVTFGFVHKILNSDGVNKPHERLQISTLTDLAHSDTSKLLLKQFSKLWEEEMTRPKPHIAHVFFKMFKKTFIIGGLCKLCQVLLQFMIPLFMYWLLNYMEEENTSALPAVACAAAMFISGVSGLLLSNQYLYKMYRIGQNVRTCVTTAVYSKCFELGQATLSQVSIGVICNYMSTDAVALCEVLPNVHLVWVHPLEIAIGFGLLLWIIGWACIFGVSFILVSVPGSLVILGVLQRHKKDMINHKDTRGRLLNEVLHDIKTVKLMVWEAYLHGKLDAARKREVDSLLKSLYARSCLQATAWCTNPLVGLFTFLIYVAVYPDDPLTPVSVFVTLAVFGMVALPIIKLPRVLSEVVQCGLALGRLTRFLLSTPMQPDNRLELAIEDSSAASAEPPVSIKDGEFQWEDNLSTALSNLNFAVRPGQLVAVIGQTGCGKSTLLHAIMGEIKRLSGEVVVRGTVAYAAQHAWVQNLSLRDNVLFGREYNPEFYDQVVNACDLARDISIITGGDYAEIGEQGCNLSGGQKQRLSLARAVYQMSDIYLLDDTLSAVDANVGENIFTNCICGLLKEKTRIFVTQQFQYLNRVDYIYVMKQGTVVESGTLEELSKHEDSEFTKLYSNYEASMSHAKEEKSTEEKKDSKSAKGDGDLIVAEQAEKGEIPMATYALYFKEVGVVMSFFIVFLYLISNVANFVLAWWLSVWTDSLENPSPDDWTSLQYLGIYFGWICLAFVLVVARHFATAKGTTNASISIHNKTLKQVVQAPMSFFYSTPVGRLLNRFSEDLLTLDDKINLTLSLVLGMALGVIVFLFGVSFLDLYLFPFVFPLLYLYIHSQEWYLVYARELFRLDVTSRSTLYASFGETLYGIRTIRCFKQNYRFLRELFHKMNNQQKAYFAVNVANRWLGVRIDFVAYSAVAVTFLVLGLERNSISASTGALCIYGIIQLYVFLPTIAQSTTEFMFQMVSMQRLQEYLHLPQEFPLVDAEAPQVPSKEWPSHGKVEFIGYTLQYRPTLPPALDNISFTINPGEKIGVVGRTGAGKSSLIVGMFRLEEAAKGRIEIDGIDISTVALRTLRSKLCVIPQDPVLFHGPLRKNLDMEEQYTDDDLYEALDSVNLKEMIQAKESGLDSEVLEGGENFSVGERQLLCLSRGLLSHSMVMVLDEATANVDLSTEEKIHKAIFEKCHSSTMILIAHRTHTILHCDRVMMLEKGALVAFGPPKELMATCPAFAALIKKSDFKE
ncbi:multidrug resistance-associated protein 3 [Pelomyxa schiedti]|nr:multidrug resistance-associated protein 3 [Pelomyxa schiedti]